jgi:hypothetical protein
MRSVRFKRTTIASFEITNQSVHYVNATVSGLLTPRYQAKQLFVIPLPPNLFKEGVLTQTDIFLATLQPYFTDELPKKTVLNIPARWISCYSLTLGTKLSAEEIETVIKLDLSNRLQIQFEQIYYDYFLQSQDGRLTAFIMFCAAAIINSRIEALRSLNINVRQVTTTYVMLITLLSRYTNPRSTLICCEDNCVTFVIMENKQLIYFDTQPLNSLFIPSVVDTVFTTVANTYDLGSIYLLGALVEPEMLNGLQKKYQCNIVSLPMFTQWTWGVSSKPTFESFAICTNLIEQAI